jgi:hypothetical protein
MSSTQKTVVARSASVVTGSSFSRSLRCQRQQRKRQIGGFGIIVIGDNALRRYGSEEQQHKRRFESMKTHAKKTTKKKGSGGGGGYGGGNSTGFSQDWANYGSFDESYFEDADTMYKPSQMFNTSKSKRKSGAQNVLEILAEERKQRRAQNYVKYEEENWDEEEEEEEYWDEEEEEEYYEEEEEFANANASSRAGSMGSVESKPKPTKPNNPPAKRAPSPAPKPKSTPPPPKPKPKPVKNETPEEAKAKATKTLLKWGFQDEDIAEAMKNASDGSTAKQMQIQVLDYLLETAPLENIPQEYLMDAKQKRM